MWECGYGKSITCHLITADSTEPCMFLPHRAVQKASWRGFEAQPDVPVCCRYKFTQRSGVHLPCPTELHVPHAFAGAFQKVGRIVERRAIEETDIHMGTEGVHVSKRCISYARRGMSIVQKLANIRSAAAHLFKPGLAHPSQLAIRPGEPGINAGVSLNGTRQ